MKVHMPTRRNFSRFLTVGIFGSSLLALSGFRFMKNIRDFGKPFAYLKDPVSRMREVGSQQLTIDGAKFSGEAFVDLAWKNIRFVNCEFRGSYEIKLESLQDCRFENCQFSGVISWGVVTSAQFLRCQTVGYAVLADFSGSTGVSYEDCRFIGEDSEPNNWGGIGSRGEAIFVRCKAKWISLAGQKALAMTDCEVEQVDVWTDSPANSGKDFQSSAVLIERSKLRGKFDLVGAELQSLCIRDTLFDNLDLSGATIKGDVLMERVRGGYIDAYVEQAKTLTVRDSQINGNRRGIFQAYAGGIGAVGIDNVVFGGSASEDPVLIAGGTGENPANPRARVNMRIEIRNSKIPHLSTDHIHTSAYLLQGCEIGSLDVSSSRIEKLELKGNTIARTVDFSDTQVQESKVQPLAPGQAKLEGSNVKVGSLR